jgi:hypothetical protein
MKIIKSTLNIKKCTQSKTSKSMAEYKKQIFICFFLFLYSVQTFAQTTDITNKLTTWGDEIKLILNMVVGIFSFVGGFLIFIQYMQGNEQAQKNFIRFIIGLAIFGLVALVANMFIPSS